MIARGTPGFSGADLENLVNEAALLAARRDGDSVSMQDFERAKDKVLMGSERRSMIISEKERRITAFHEAGHALIAMLEDDSDPVHKVTIIPRGGALGVTMTLPTEDKYCVSKNELLATIARAMGGRAAEDLVFDHFSTGAVERPRAGDQDRARHGVQLRHERQARADEPVGRPQPGVHRPRVRRRRRSTARRRRARSTRRCTRSSPSATRTPSRS